MGRESTGPVWITGVRKRPHFNIYSLKNNPLVLLHSVNRKIGVGGPGSTRAFFSLNIVIERKLN